MKRRDMVAGAAASLLTGQVPLAFAQGWPERPIRAIQGFAAGGNADTIARLVGMEMSKGLGQPIVVEAVTGAGGTIASAAVARAAPHGDSLFLSSGGPEGGGEITPPRRPRAATLP